MMRQMTTMVHCALTMGLVCVSGSAHGAALLPDFTAATFVAGAPVNNPYFPLLSRQTHVYVSQKTGEEDRFELMVLGPGPLILGIQTTVQRDRAFEDGLLVEDTFDYYAQDTAGNVWYLGEDVTNYLYDAAGNLIGTNNASAWRAGENFADPLGNPAQPGFIMPAVPTIGFEYFQEFAPDDGALDQATHLALIPHLTLARGTFSNVLQVLETIPLLEPDARGFKYYAPGVGLILVAEDLDSTLQNPAATLELARVVSEPATLTLCGLGLAALWLLGAGKTPWRKKGARAGNN